ncbi:hypothetical protein [Methylobacterium sp. Leaf118]|uniref:hypothetical protein n=1 Tax=Methylobacterium sp. Leaf118 TaxID=2876562 RepID=UPI001E36549A|nr:hypothetical protein [Methylobacterium sp. Leaf118]
MRGVPALLAGSGLGSRVVFGLASVAALAAFAWPVTVDPPPPPAVVPASTPLGDAALRRPLFDPGRRDWTARGDRSAVLEGEPRRPVLTLRGIVVDGGTARALIDDGGGEPHWLARGEGRGNWQVAAIEPDGVTLTQNGRSFRAVFMGEPATLRPLPLGAVPLRP